MEIKRLTIQAVEDAVCLFDKYRQFYKQQSDETAARSFLTERLAKEQSIVFLAYKEDLPVGFVQLYPTFSSVALQKAFILNDLYVDHAARGQGIGQALIKYCYAFCEEQQARYITLETAETNTAAQRLYEQLGMQEDQDVRHYYRYW